MGADALTSGGFMNVLFLYADDDGAPKQHVLQGAPDDFEVDGFDLSILPDRNPGGTTHIVILDDIKRPTVLDADSGDEIGATFSGL
jgi:hypothetical protein